MIVVVLFIVILVLTFGVVYVITRPSKGERVLEDRLSDIAQGPVAATVEDDPGDILRKEGLSDIPVLEAILQRFGPMRRLQKLLVQSDTNWSVGRVVLTTLLLLVAVPIISSFFVANVVLQVLFTLVAVAVLYGFFIVKRANRLRMFNERLPEAIDLITRALKAAHSITSAIEMVAREVGPPVGPEFRKCFEQQNFGLPLREALLQLAERVPVPDLQFLVTAILVQKETGGNLVEILEKTAAVIRERLRLKGQLRVYTAQGRLTGWILAGLPFFVFGVMNFLNPGYARILIDDPFGRKLVYAGLALMAVGAWVIRKIVDVKV